MFIDVIKESFAYFPLIALIFTFPYILYRYHKSGVFFSFRIVIVYSFIFYMMTSYFLVILPLPSFEAVSNMSGSTYQLVPFTFIKDIIKEAKTGLNPIYLNRALIQFVFNIVMTIPFGIYLKYYFECSFKKTLIYSFLLTLFFELTQLSGLYFLYPRAYRLFDVDDLLANTIGGVVGYFLARPLIKVLPSKKQMDESEKEASKNISFLRSFVAFNIDLLILVMVFAVVYFSLKLTLSPKTMFYVALMYFIVCPLVYKSKTFGKAFVHIEIRDDKNFIAPLKSAVNTILFYALYLKLPMQLIQYIHIIATEILPMEEKQRFVLYAFTMILLLIYYIVEAFFILLDKKALPYRITKTKKVSSLKLKETNV